MKSFSVSIRILLLVALILGVSISTRPAKAGSLDVCPSGCTYSTIASAVAAATGGDTITVAAGTYPEHNITIDKDLSLIGAGSGLVTVDAQSLGRIFHILDNLTVSIAGMTITNGYLPFASGAGIYSTGLSLTLDDMIITHNNAGNYPTSGNYSSGGGILSGGDLYNSQLTITNSQITQNTSVYEGAGISAYFGSTVHLTNVVVQDNVTTGPSGYGGGIAVDSESGNESSLSLERVTLEHNISGHSGGGLSIQAYGILTITNSTIIFNHSSQWGGGLEIDDYTPATLTNVTIAGNIAGTTGGGIFFNGNHPAGTLKNVTIAGNSAHSHGGYSDEGLVEMVSLLNTIITSNSDVTGSPDCGGAFTSLDYNLIQNTSGCNIHGTTTHNITGISPNLGALANNGGATRTIALLTGSPAIDAGTNTGCPRVDQRGYLRPYGLSCDIGAYEYGSVPGYWIFLPVIYR